MATLCHGLLSVTLMWPCPSNRCVVGTVPPCCQVSTAYVHMDPRLQAARVLSCWQSPLAGGENGFNQAIELSADTLANVKFVQEKRLISKFFDEISQDTSKYVFGVSDTLQCLEMGAVDTLIVWEDLPVWRYELMNSVTGTVARGDLPVQCCQFAHAVTHSFADPE